MALYQLDAHRPEVHESAWVADNAQVMGAVKLAADASVWFGCTVRGDTETIEIGEGSNIQDGSVMHADHGKPLTVGKNVTVGHMVMLHGCTIGDESLIGIGAVVLNGAKIGKNCLVGAGSLVTEGKEFPDGSMIMGTPAKVVRELSDDEVKWKSEGTGVYQSLARRCRTSLVPVQPLAEDDENRRRYTTAELHAGRTDAAGGLKSLVELKRTSS